LFYAAAKGFDAVVQALLDAGADVNLVDSSGNCTLHFACNTSVAKLLISAGKSTMPTLRNSSGNTPLHAAYALRSAELIDVLLVADPSPLRTKNKNENTPEECAFSGRFLFSWCE
jgi:ankyrin repeat protein